ncbi:hypothetical protein [Rhizorhabdus histidinilytica]|uniref:hypothetical protein n=1 Tax=Rhizorhabdus histidinilytica TaxID=439228 RepID=UPI0032207E27
MKGIILAAIAAIASPAAAADQFDLVCSGTRTWSTHGKPEPYQIRYRIDLSTGSWCREACTQVQPFASVDAGQLVFSKRDTGEPTDIWTLQRVNRSSGNWEYKITSPGINGTKMEAKGHCEKADFSGFPPNKF